MFKWSGEILYSIDRVYIVFKFLKCDKKLYYYIIFVKIYNLL